MVVIRADLRTNREATLGERRQTPDDQDLDRAGQQNLLSGEAHGSIVQAGTVHGGINVQPSIPDTGQVIPRQLLPAPARFAGRLPELAQLHELIAKSSGSAPTVIILRGPGGVGKTALALRWLGHVADGFRDGNLYADLALSTGQPVAPEDVLGHFLRALGVAPQRIPSSLAERTALYRSVTARLDFVVLLDNAVSAAQAQVLLPAGTNSLAVVTSRRPLLGLLAGGAHAVQVDPLGAADALELLSHTIGSQRIQTERRSAERLAGLCGGLPIALCVAAARIASRPRRSLARMIDELSDERARLDGLSAEGDLSVRATFDVAYGALPSPLQHIYRTMGLHPGKAFSVEAAAVAIGADPRAARRALDELVDASLLEDFVGGEYRFHDLVRVHALDQALSHDSDEDRAAVVRNVLHWYLFAAQAANRVVMPARRVLTYEFGRSVHEFQLPAGIDHQVTAMGWLANHRANLVAATQDAAKFGWPELAYHLADALQPLFILHRYQRSSLEIGEVALRAAEAWGNSAAEASARKRLGRTYAQLGHFDRAQYHATELLRRARARHDRRAEASALKNTALLLAATGQLQEAVATFDQVIAILRALNKRRGEGLARIELADVLMRLDHTDAAISQSRQAGDILSALEPPDPYHTARAMSRLGQAYLGAGNLELARGLLQEAITVLAAQDAGPERGRAHRALATLSRRAGDEEGARRHDETADALLGADEPAPDADD